jgi:hypothetical protein
VSAFDAELYLRLIGEEMLLDRGDESHGPQRPTISEAAAALVAVGVIDAPRADSVLDDYSLAATLRNDPQFHRRMMMRRGSRQPGENGKGLKPRRVVPCPQTIGQPQATVQVRYVSLSEDETSVAVRWHPDPSRPWAGVPPGATLTDDRGTTVTAPFSGGGSHQGMSGRLITPRPLAPDTKWIVLNGTRIDLTGEPSGFAATVERLPEQDPAHCYLWRRITEPDEFAEHGIEPAVDALVAAGALSADDALLDDVRVVLEAMQQRGPGPAVGPPALDRLPDPWRSLLARQGRDDGPTGSIVLGAVTPPFDGFSVAVLDLESDATGFRVDVEVAPGAGHRMPFDWSVRPRELAWWAKDDRGNHYLGRRGNWSYTEDSGNGLIDFHPALDPRATQLVLMPAAVTTRAVISFALPFLRERAAASGASR